MTALIDIVREAQRDLSKPLPRSPRPTCPTRTGFWAAESLGDVLRAAGVKPERYAYWKTPRTPTSPTSAASGERK